MKGIGVELAELLGLFRGNLFCPSTVEYKALTHRTKGNQQMTTSKSGVEKRCGGNHAQTLLEKHSALGNCSKRKQTLFCAKEGKF